MAAIITLIIAAALGTALRCGRTGAGLLHRPYNNRYNAASASRDESVS